MTSAPYTFEEATRQATVMAAAQSAGEDLTRRAYADLAEAERAYRKALAAKITELRAGNTAATLAADLARGDEHVASLRFRRDVAEGVVEAARQAGWRHQANRRDGHEFIQWSARRDLAEGYHGAQQPKQFDNVTPERAR
jgi:hypothetical protein